MSAATPGQRHSIWHKADSRRWLTRLVRGSHLRKLTVLTSLSLASPSSFSRGADDASGTITSVKENAGFSFQNRMRDGWIGLALIAAANASCWSVAMIPTTSNWG